jgi:hypothetical protein
MSTAGLREVPELKVQERPPSTCAGAEGAGVPTTNVKTSMAGARAEGPGAPTIHVKTSTADPQEVPELKVRERPPST